MGIEDKISYNSIESFLNKDYKLTYGIINREYKVFAKQYYKKHSDKNITIKTVNYEFLRYMVCKYGGK